MPRVVVQSGLIAGPFPVTLLRDSQARRQPRVTGTVRTAPAGKAQTPGLKGCEGRWGFCESHARPGAAADSGPVPGPPRGSAHPCPSRLRRGPRLAHLWGSPPPACLSASLCRLFPFPAGRATPGPWELWEGPWSLQEVSTCLLRAPAPARSPWLSHGCRSAL